MKKAAFLFFLVGSEKRRLCGALFCFFGYEVLYDFAKVCRKGKNEVFQNGGVCVHRLGFLGKGQAHKPIEHFYDFEQLPPVGGGVHGNKYVGQAVYGFHVAACCYPYHFCEWLRDCSGYKVYLILADLAGLEYHTLVYKIVFHLVVL